MKKIFEEARRMIRINSVSANGNEELANYCQQLMQERGLKTSLQQVQHSFDQYSKRQFNVVGVLGDPLVDRKIRKGLLLNTHLDTVSPGLAENWTETGGDPFAATIKDGKIYGLGAADVKLDFLCKLHAVERFRERKLKMPIYLVGTCGEEVGMFGVKYLIKSGALNPKFVLVGEPSDLRVVYAHKALMLFKISVVFQGVEKDAKGFNRRIDLHAFGKSAHSSYPHLGTNAIFSVLDLLKGAQENGFEMRFTRFDGGDTVNKVPDHALLQFYLNSHQFEDFKRYFREILRVQGKERAFRVELGGAGEVGVRFLPDAVYLALQDVVAAFRSLGAELQIEQDGSFAPPHSTMNMGRMLQSEGRLDLNFDLRLLPSQNIDEMQTKIEGLVREIGTKYPMLNVVAQVERTNPGLNMTAQSELVKLAEEALIAAGLEPQLDKKATSTEAAQYFKSGYEAVVFGPGVSPGNAHSPNEHNLLEQMEKATVFYEKMIEKTCL